MTDTATNPPSNANETCVGPQSSNAGKADSCEGCPNQASCASGEHNSPEALAAKAKETRQLEDCLSSVSHTILVLSGKGGVGKSTVATQTALTLANQGYAVGLLDVDLCGPSAPRMVLGEQSSTATIRKAASGLWIPVYIGNLAVMSIAFMLADRNQSVVWRGPRKNALIQQFLSSVDWRGDTNGLDYLIIDTPPGTSDEHISTVQYLQQAQQNVSALVVTTPEEASLADVRKELNFCQKTKLPVLGIVENMGTLETGIDQLLFSDSQGNDCSENVLALIRSQCPQLLDYAVQSKLFCSDNSTTVDPTQHLAETYGCNVWGRLPLNRDLLAACDNGVCYARDFSNSRAAKVLSELCRKIVQACPVDASNEG